MKHLKGMATVELKESKTAQGKVKQRHFHTQHKERKQILSQHQQRKKEEKTDEHLR